MSPQNARVFIVEDESGWQKIYRYRLENTDHTIVQIATNMEEAEEALPTLTEMGIQVAIIDGNISSDGREGHEGMYLIREIKRLHPQIKTIGMSGMFDLGADIDLGKANCKELAQTITNF